MTLIDVLPSVEVTAPAVTPYPFGLFSVAPASVPADDHWASGIWWRSAACNSLGVTHNPCVVDDPVPALAPNVVCGIVGGEAFTVYARSDESMGGAPIDAKFQAARNLLLAGEQFAVETELWAMLLAAVPTADATAVDAQEAIAMAEALIADNYGGAPTLHMSRYAATMGAWAIRIEGSTLKSLLGASVVAGGGYGTSPIATGSAFSVIATGALVVVRSVVDDVGRYYDHATNRIDAVVQRTYAIGWDCTAVRVDVPAVP